MINIYLSQKGNHSTWVLIIDEWPLCLLVRAGLQPPAVQEQVCLHLSFSVNFQYFRRLGAQCLPNKESMITLCCKSLKSRSNQKKLCGRPVEKVSALKPLGASAADLGPNLGQGDLPGEILAQLWVIQNDNDWDSHVEAVLHKVAKVLNATNRAPWQVVALDHEWVQQKRE